jgi:hypothetical protein
MKYFTPELYERLQNFDPAAMGAADTEWEAASAKYEQHCSSLHSEAVRKGVRPLRSVSCVFIPRH